MKFLCLHGMGTNASIFDAQTEMFRGLLPPHFTYMSFDGEHICPPASGVSEVFPPPYLCYYSIPTCANVAAAHQLLDEIIDDDGPFDGVIGFSQGAALAASYLLRHELTQTSMPPPFRLAIFICASLPFSIDEKQGIDITEMFNSQSAAAESELFSKKIDTIPSDIFVPRHDTASRPLKNDTSSNSFQNRNEQSEAVARKEALSNPENRVCRFYPTALKARINIPTAHIYGRQDAYFSQGRRLLDLCTSKKAVHLELPGGHMIPRDRRLNVQIVGCIERAIALSEQIN